ncbi:outer membrane beta-barrel protein [Vibrio sp. YMD68]|uniref:outer membrane beta-barrel protein n=1 Tax=Vibrio sp. YMD68 TaxID=3042300 RepID=UPI00249C7B55|nr:outer membrane beta-barrel protein [Vibrio sp. YMD68]WGV98428.1 outer membrane beta-barrel protein [Vibrio sp. YMD68]
MNGTRLSNLALVVMCIFGSGVSFANPVNFNFDEVKDSPITALIDIDTGYNDNLTREANETDAISSSFIKVFPGLAYTYKPSASRYSLLYVIDSGYFFNSKDDNYTDQYFESNNLISFNPRNNLSLTYSYYATHEERGTGLSEGTLESLAIAEPVEYTNQNIQTHYLYGAPSATGQLKFGLGYQDKTYTNYKSFTRNNIQYGSQFSDFTSKQFSAAFFYRLRASTKLSVSAERDDKQYQYTAENTANRDNITDYYSLGAMWDITDKTLGEISVGLQDKEFSSNERSDFSGLSWRVKTDWLPQRHSKLSLFASLSAEDPDQLGDYINETLVKLSWKQDWFERFSTTALVSWENDDYTASSDIGNREDDTYLYQLDFNYQFSRILHFGLYLSSEDKNSTWSAYRYDQQLVGLYTRIEL